MPRVSVLLVVICSFLAIAATSKSCDTCTVNTDCAEEDYCEKGVEDCKGYGVCAERPEVCPFLFDPVCGCDDQTYANDCIAAQNGVNIAYSGECDSVAKACLDSGGYLRTNMCCQSTGDFPNTCLVGACGCSPDNSHEVEYCDCPTEQCFNGEQCMPIE